MWTGLQSSKWNGALLAKWEYNTHPGTAGWGRCGPSRQLLTSDTGCKWGYKLRGAMRKSRYWVLKKYKETVGCLRQSDMGFTLNDDLEDVHKSSSCFTEM